MHRTHRIPRLRIGGLLLAFLAGSLTVPCAGAQDLVPPPQASTLGNVLVVPAGGTKLLQMSTTKNIVRGQADKAEIARISSVIGDPTRVLIAGLQPGLARVTLTDADGKVETFDIVVQLDVEYLKYLLRIGVPTASINVQPGASGTVILTGYLTRAEDIQLALDIARSVIGDRIINGLRIGGVQQVQLDVVVAQVARSEMRNLSFAFQQSGTDHFVASTLGLSSTVAGSAATGIASSSSSLSGSPGNLFLGIVGNRESFFGFLEALRNENLLKLMAQPKLIAMSGRSASFLSGGEQAIPVPAGLGQVGVQFEEFGTRINFLPIVLENGMIHLEVEPEVSNLNAAFGTSIQGSVVPGRNTDRVHTTVELMAGQTYVIGGLIQTAENGTDVKVPIIGDLPFLGFFFSSKNYQVTETELLVMVTPYLVDSADCAQLPKLLPGQETRRPDDFELFLEGILEAPRGPRDAFPDCHYLAPYKNSPSAGVFPCAGRSGCGQAGCGQGSCGRAGSGEQFVGQPSPLPLAPSGMVAAPRTAGQTSTGMAASPKPTPPAAIQPPVAAGGDEESSTRTTTPVLSWPAPTSNAPAWPASLPPVSGQ
jgi:pilus assembly protein CpaC